MARCFAVALSIALGVVGCGPRRLGWEIVFADAALGARARRVEGRILVGGCASTSVRYAAEAGRGETPAMPPRLEPGHYGFEGRARDETCQEFATGCVEVDVPQADGTIVTVTLTASPERPSCAGSICTDGRCSSGDAGPTDGGGMDAGAGDTGPGDAGPSDVGPGDAPAPPDAPDAGTPDAGPPPDAGCMRDADCADCHTCALGACVPQTDGATCRAAAGVCHSGACCDRCWDGTACAPGDAATACGAAGVDCVACGSAMPLCETGGVCGVGQTIDAVDVGTAFACALASGGLWCWGSNFSGQLGQGTVGPGAELSTPTRVGALASWTRLGLGDDHLCVAAGAALSCWGDNEDAQIGFADHMNRYFPTLVTSATGPWARLEGPTGGDHTCTLDPAGVVACMGQNDYGQLGVGDNSERSVLTPWSGTWRSVGGGHHFSCGVGTDGTLACTGRNTLGQLGLGTSGVGFDTNAPTRVGTDTTWTLTAVGYEHACALRGAGELWCWGDGSDADLGLGSRTSSTVPARVGAEADWSAIALGSGHSCGIRAGGELHCWGRNADGQVGIDTASVSDVLSPARVGSASDWVSVHAGGNFTCGVRAGGALYCWGDNALGELGQGDTASRIAPTRVFIPRP